VTVTVSMVAWSAVTVIGSRTGTSVASAAGVTLNSPGAFFTLGVSAEDSGDVLPALCHAASAPWAHAVVTSNDSMATATPIDRVPDLCGVTLCLPCVTPTPDRY